MRGDKIYFSSCILKLTSNCNLNCSYCYMFNLKDTTHKAIPRFMSNETSLKTLHRIDEHLEEYPGRTFELILHGGEPSLWPSENFDVFLASFKLLQKKHSGLKIFLQTNGYRMLPEKTLSNLLELNTSIGISLDGPKWLNDKYRLTLDGRGTYETVMKNVEKLISGKYSELLSGFLSVAEPSINPTEYFSWIKSMPVKSVDVLWPMQFTRRRPPWDFGGDIKYKESPRWGSWFAALFNIWIDEDDPSVKIRSFDELVRWALGEKSHGDSVINDRLEMIVVNTDGRIEYPDYLRNAWDGASRTNYSVQFNTLSELSNDRTFSLLSELGKSLPTECSGCLHKDICGRGFLPGRTDEKELLSIYKSILCFDQYHYFHEAKKSINARLKNLITHDAEISDYDKTAIDRGIARTNT